MNPKPPAPVAEYFNHSATEPPYTTWDVLNKNYKALH